MSLAQAIALACRLHSIYYADQAVFSNGATWYQPYIDYAIQNGILTAGTYSDYNANATRAQFASILAAALPESALAPINDITSIPDVSAADSYADAVYRLYNAGIIKGKDRYGTFAPESSIQRAEAATIVTLMADPSMRTSFTLDFKLTPQALQGVWRYEERDPDSDYVEYRELIFDGEESIRIFYHENYSGIDHTVPKTGYDLYSRGRVTTEEKATFTNPNASAAAYAQWGIFTSVSPPSRSPICVPVRKARSKIWTHFSPLPFPPQIPSRRRRKNRYRRIPFPSAPYLFSISMTV